MNERFWNQVSLGAIVVMVGVLIVQVALPRPTLGKVVQKRTEQATKLRGEVEKFRDEVAAAKVKNATRVWSQTSDQVSATAMQKVNALAQKQQLKVASFRPQRTQDDSGVTRYPYLVALDGYFPKVMAFVRELETPSLKLPVVTVQIASADGASDHVTATVGIVAFRETEKKP